MTERPHLAAGMIMLATAGIAAAFWWNWSEKTADPRAAASLVAGVGEIRVRPGFADCPGEIYDRFRAALLTAAEAREAEALSALDDATVAALLTEQPPARDAVRRLAAAVPSGKAVLGLCRDDTVVMATVDPQTGAVERRASRPMFPRASQEKARLHLVTRPAGATVQLDFEDVGTTPLALGDVEPGGYDLRLKSRSHVTVDQPIALTAGVTTFKLVELQRGEGRVAVSTWPQGAAVAIDGIRQPTTTPAVFGPLPSGHHRLEMEMAPFDKLATEVTVPAGDTAFVSLSFPQAPPERRRSWTDPATGMEFRWVPGGCYRMGCGSWTSDCDPDEKQLHDVCVDGFWMGRTEVTQGQWRSVMGSNPSTHTRSDDRPVNQVTWHDAKAFVARLNARGGARFRLPTEAEWEYACRSGGRPEKYAGATEAAERAAGLAFLDGYAWIGRMWEEGPFPVGGKAPNGLGLHDMSGNVWEWLEDAFEPHAYLVHAAKNPVHRAEVRWRAVRGGSWFNHNRLGRCSHRYRFDAGFRNVDLGLRLVREAE